MVLSVAEANNYKEGPQKIKNEYIIMFKVRLVVGPLVGPGIFK